MLRIQSADPALFLMQHFEWNLPKEPWWAQYRYYLKLYFIEAFQSYLEQIHFKREELRDIVAIYGKKGPFLFNFILKFRNRLIYQYDATVCQTSLKQE